MSCVPSNESAASDCIRALTLVGAVKVAKCYDWGIMGKAVFTIGHSNHERDAFFVLLAEHGIELLVDTRTSRLVAATSVEASATDFNVAGLLLGRHAGGGLGMWSKTPVEKAIRLAIQEAVHSIVRNTPDRYFRYGAFPVVPQPAVHPTPADPLQSGPSTQ